MLIGLGTALVAAGAACAVGGAVGTGMTITALYCLFM